MSEWIKCLKCNRIWDSCMPPFDNICIHCTSHKEINEHQKKFWYALDKTKPRGYNMDVAMID